MILQSLYQLYGRLSQDPANGLPLTGYSLQNVTFCIVLREDGTVIEFRDLRKSETFTDKKGKEKKILRPLELILPGQSKPTGQGINPCTMWDNLTYLAGYPQPDKSPAKFEKNRLRAPRCFAESKKHHEALFSEPGEEPRRKAVAKYFARHSPEDLIPFIELLPDDARIGNGIFQLSGETRFVHQAYKPLSADPEHGSNEVGQCLITGTKASIARLHEPKIKNFDPKGSLLVSFNEKAYESFGKEDGRKVGQGRNAPVSEVAAFAYCNALNWLLSNRRFRIGDATTVFWTAAPTPAETLFPWMISGMPEAEDKATHDRLKGILERISRGTLSNDDLGDPDVPYYILGLSPNSSRLSVRFWHTGTLRELTSNLKLHLNHLEIVRQWDETNSKNPEPLHPSSYQLLRQTARDADGIPPQLAGSLMRSILLGTRYPDSLINGVMNRIRVVEKKPKGEGSLDNVSYFRAAILKAWLIRNHNQRITTMLDETNTNPGYLLGRLFAVLEKTQQDALPGINATIRDRFYSSASATPRAVFGRLLRTYQHHLAKLPVGGKITRERLTQEILASLTDFPAHLNLQNQAQFALGYYHQRKALYPTKAPEPQETATV